MKNLKTIFLLLLTVHFCFANMASPMREGSKNASAFSSKDVAILHENIVVHISQDFKTAKYTIEYTIKSDVVGGQIPLLFLAQDFKDNFTVWLDGKPVAIKNIPEQYYKTQNSPFANFTNSFTDIVDNNQYISIYWQPRHKVQYNLDDLKYFETNLTQGEHKIRVEYLANVWVDKSNQWINEYSFRYSLAPAKSWKSFESLDITVFQDGNVKPLTTNLGNPREGKFDTMSTWNFNKLPADSFDIYYKPEIKGTAKTLIAIDPFGIAFLSGIVLMLIHIVLNYWHRKRNAIKKYSWVVIIGSFIVSYLMLHIYFISYAIIDGLIGVDASGRHGYYFVIVIFYPVLVVVYMAIMWVIDVIMRKKLTKTIL